LTDLALPCKHNPNTDQQGAKVMARCAGPNSIQGWFFVSIASLGLQVLSLDANAACTLGKLAELKVTMNGLTPVIRVLINGKELKFAVDSSSYYNIVGASAAASAGLRLMPAPSWLAAKGADGKSLLSVAAADDFMVGGLRVKNIEFLAGGGDSGSGIDGVLGQSWFQNYDVEYDLGNSVIRLMRPEDCADAGLAYWATAKQTYSVVEINSMTPAQPFVTGVAMLNGAQIRVLFDTGANASRISPQAAAHAGLKADPSDLVDAGYSRGMGRPAVMTHLAPFSSFKVGDEEIRNPRLRVGDTREGTDMLLGADFFLSHRIFVSNEQRKVYFTYNGGPVFSASR
jgi:predicted aspartyl protease